MLKPLSDIEDYKKIYDMYSDGSNAVFFRHFDKFLTFEQFCNTINLLGITVLKEEGLGYLFITIYKRPKIASVSAIVNKTDRGSGHGIKMIEEACRHLIYDEGIVRLIMQVSEDDGHTKRISEVGGFKKECVHKNASFYNEEFHDEVRYVMTSEEFIDKYVKR